MSRPRWRRLLLIWLLLLGGLYGAMLSYLWATQESRLFFPRPLDEARAATVLRQVPATRSIWLQATDGTRLHAWWRPGQGEAGRTLIYFGGNAEDVHWRLAEAERYAGWDLLLVDYRGYGLSQGQPGQAAMQADALLWFDHLAQGKLAGLAAPQQIAVMGTSMGSYFATYLAAHRPVAGIVLATPFDSVRDYVQTRLPLVPVRLLLRHPLDSRAHAGAIRAPSLFIVAANDNTIPPERAEILYKVWAGQPRHWVLVPQSNHHTITAEPLYWETLQRFLGGLP